MSVPPSQRIGVVVIGRNEGERLARCLRSVDGQAAAVVYVDSGSTDGSVELAQDLGAEVVNLDTSIRFTAARGRNAGLTQLRGCHPATEFVQFVDGDCEVVAGWLATAAQTLATHQDVAVVCGRRRERFPGASIYNRLCDIEWNTPIGDARACGGDALMRVAPLREIDGYDASLIAGEEPELCLRLRKRGWRIVRIDAEMTLHDAAMSRFGQWWKRAVRAGHAYAEGAWLHGRSPERHWVRESLSAVFWGGLLPLAALVPAWATHGLSLFLLLAYALQWWRIRRHARHSCAADGSAGTYALFTLIAKFAQLRGLLGFVFNRLRGTRAALIEYKQTAAPSPKEDLAAPNRQRSC